MEMELLTLSVDTLSALPVQSRDTMGEFRRRTMSIGLFSNADLYQFGSGDNLQRLSGIEEEDEEEDEEEEDNNGEENDDGDVERGARRKEERKKGRRGRERGRAKSTASAVSSRSARDDDEDEDEDEEYDSYDIGGSSGNNSPFASRSPRSSSPLGFSGHSSSRVGHGGHGRVRSSSMRRYSTATNLSCEDDDDMNGNSNSPHASSSSPLRRASSFLRFQQSPPLQSSSAATQHANASKTEPAPALPSQSLRAASAEFLRNVWRVVTPSPNLAAFTPHAHSSDLLSSVDSPMHDGTEICSDFHRQKILAQKQQLSGATAGPAVIQSKVPFSDSIDLLV